MGTARALWRGLRKRCPRCGAAGIFKSWFDLKETCPGCDLRFEKEDGGFLGAMVINYAIAFAVWIVMLTVVLVLMLPVVPVIQLIVASIGIFVVSDLVLPAIDEHLGRGRVPDPEDRPGLSGAGEARPPREEA